MIVSLEVYINCNRAGVDHNTHVRLKNDSNAIVVACNGKKGEVLIRSIEEQGKLIGKKEKLPLNINYSEESYKQNFSLPVSFSFPE
jgi:hypothetical protein